MNLHIGIPLFAVSMLLQAVVFPAFGLTAGQPDLIVVLVLTWSILDNDREGMAWAFTGGLFLDLLSGAPLGVSSLLLVPLAFVLGFAEAQVYRRNVFLPLLLMALGAGVYHIGYLVLLSVLNISAISLSDALFSIALPSVVFDVILVLPALRLLAVWYDRLHPRKVALADR